MEIHHTTTEVNGFTVQQVMLETRECTKPSMASLVSADKVWKDQQSSDLVLSSCQSAKTFSLFQKGVVSLTPSFIFSTSSSHF